MKPYLKTNGCACGREHRVDLDEILIGSGVLHKLPACIERYGAKKPFLLADCNTYQAAGRQVCQMLEKHEICYGSYIFREEHLEPDECAVGSAVMHYDSDCDLIIGIGSGVINDICKILSNISGRRYIIVATAPSMDGYTSATSSMSRDGLKVSVKSRCPDIIIGDVDILKQAPTRLLKAGLGDMIAKYVSVAEWRISHLVNGEYYCEAIAGLIRQAVQKCMDNAAGLLKREAAAVEAVFEGLVIGGIAMAYAGISRPASGIEHYCSHIWDMRGLSLGTPVDLHGIQCASGTFVCVKLYKKLKTMTPDAKKAYAFVEAFRYEDWSLQLKEFLGSSADAMIALEAEEQKYSKEKHQERFPVVAAHWEEILQILEEELPPLEQLSTMFDVFGFAKDLTSLGMTLDEVKQTIRASKDIRNKYGLSHLAWDLGVLDELCECL